MGLFSIVLFLSKSFSYLKLLAALKVFKGFSFFKTAFLFGKII